MKTPPPNIELIKHKGKIVIFCDYTHCKNNEESIKMLHTCSAYFQEISEPLLVISDITNVLGSKEFMNEAKKLKHEVFDKRIKKGALLGVTGMKKVLLKSYNIFSKHKREAFDTKEEALDYLVKD